VVLFFLLHKCRIFAHAPAGNRALRAQIHINVGTRSGIEYIADLIK
jgi:hypothetical protein